MTRKRKDEKMGYWHKSCGRGSQLEEDINRTNQLFRNKKMALVQKIPTPIKPLKLDEKTRKITLAYFEEKSTVDYIGMVQDRGIAFDCKECSVKTSFPLKNVHKHQVEYMRDFEEQGGICFLIVRFSHLEIQKTFFLPFKLLARYYDQMEKAGGPKSIPLKAFEAEVPCEGGFWNYLKPMLLYLDN